MPYWRLSGVYFCYFASLGAIFPFWGPYLKQQGFNAQAIGELMAIIMATKIIAPNLWHLCAYRYSSTIKQARLAALLTWISFLLVFWAKGFWHLALVMGLFSFFWNASLPQFEAITLNHLRERVRQYGNIRLWGSIGFIVTVIGLGQGLEHLGVWLVPVVMLITYIGLWLASLLIPEPKIEEHALNLVESPVLFVERLALLCACFMMQASHGVYYAFYSLYLEQHGYADILIGRLWALGVIVEVGLFSIMQQILQYAGTRRILIVSLALATLRWLLIGIFPQYLYILTIAQGLHAFTFGAFHASAIHLVHNYFPGRSQSMGQGLYSSLSFGAGGAVGSLISGYLWVDIGPTLTFMIAAGIAFLGATIAWIWVDPQHRY